MKPKQLLPIDGFPVYYSTLNVLNQDNIDELNDMYEGNHLPKISIERLKTNQYLASPFYKPISKVLIFRMYSQNQ